jgi:hypothetical protein
VSHETHKYNVWKNAEFLTVTPGIRHSYHEALKLLGHLRDTDLTGCEAMGSVRSLQQESKTPCTGIRLKIEAVCSSEMFLNLFQTTRCHISVNSDIQEIIFKLLIQKTAYKNVINPNYIFLASDHKDERESS